MVLNDVAKSVIEAQRGKDSVWVFPYKEDRPLAKMNDTAWKSARRLDSVVEVLLAAPSKSSATSALPPAACRMTTRSCAASPVTTAGPPRGSEILTSRSALTIKSGSRARAGATPSAFRQTDIWAIAFDNLVRWISKGVTPPRAPRIELEADGRTVKRDANGNALGGVRSGFVSARDSLGLTFGGDGKIRNVVPGMAGDKAGLAAGLQVIGVNGRKFGRQRLRDALADSVTLRQVELLLQDGDRFRTVTLDYADGPKYLELVRDPDKPDVLADILKPRAGAANRPPAAGK